MTTDFKFSKTSLKNMEGVKPNMIAVAHKALEYSPVDFGVPGTGGLRTVELQKRLYNQGASRCDGVMYRSKHQSGEALDIYAWVAGNASWEPHHLLWIAVAFFRAAAELGVKIKWGGFFKFKDMGHFELVIEDSENDD